MDDNKKKRIAMMLFGNFIIGISIGMFNVSTFGVDPFTSLVKGMSSFFHIGLGNFQVMANLLVIIFEVFFYRKGIGIGTIINMFCIGYIVQGFEYIVEHVLSITALPLLVCILFVIFGLLLLSFGAAVYMAADLGIAPYDSLALIFEERSNGKLPYRYARMGTDLFCVIVGVTSGIMSKTTVAGVVTVATAFCMGPFVQFFREKVAKPFLYGKKDKS